MHAELREEDSADKPNDYIEQCLGRSEPVTKVSEESEFTLSGLNHTCQTSRVWLNSPTGPLISYFLETVSATHSTPTCAVIGNIVRIEWPTLAPTLGCQ